MLEKTITYKDGSNSHDWNLTLPIDPNYANQKKRLLVILQTIDSRDLKAEGVLADKRVRTAFVEAIKLGRKFARQRKPDLGEFGLAVVNYNARRHLHLKEQARIEAEAEFKARVQKIIKKLNPTHILFSGDLSVLYPVKDAPLKNGWVHEFEGRKVTSTVDFAKLLDKEGLYANLLGFWCRHLANLLVGSLPYSLAGLEPKPMLVDTVAKFDHMMAEWDKVEAKGGFTGLDTETKNLTVNNNRIFTMQMTFDHDPLVGYVLPIDHPHKDNPFTVDERKYIKRQLKARFGAPDRKSKVITFNGIFDIRVIRKALHLDIIYMGIWECMAGEHLLDENASSLRYVGVSSDDGQISANGLAGVLCSYGNDFYLRDMSFGKKDRATVANVSPRDKGFLKYAAMDTVSMIGIRKSQIERADAHFPVAGKGYKSPFIRHMMHQMSDTVHQLSHLKEAGSLVNKKYLRSLMQPDSVLAKAIKELGEEFKTFPEVIKANKALLADSGFKAGGLFGSKKGGGAWTFSFTKAAHKAKLFLEVMGMEAVNKTKQGAPSIDKDFIETYKDRNFLVAKFGEWTAANKMLGTIVKGWLKILTRTFDGTFDDHLRSEIIFFDVDTGRLASRNPNLQNIPNRGKLAKIIKEMFITVDGHLMVRYDYSAHEVRGWSIVALDKILASAFKVGQSLRQKWIKVHPPMVLVNSEGQPIKLPMAKDIRATYEAELKTSKDKERISLLKRVIETDDLAARLKKEGDIHIQNVFRFFNKWVEKSDPLRDAIKAVVFGTIYGKSAATLGNDTKKAEFDAIKEKMSVAHKAGDQKTLDELIEKYNALQEDDREDYAQNIIDKMFSQFKAGHKWLLTMSEKAEQEQHVYSPIFRVRHLWATITKDRAIISRQVRRGMNAPIQGFASEVAVKASRLVMLDYYKNQDKLKTKIGLDPKAKFPIRFNRMVHDASYFTVPYSMVLPFMHILQYDATYGVTKAYKDEFDLEFTVEPEIEMEVGVQDTKSNKWGWAIPELLQHLSTSVDDGIKAGFLTESKADIMAQLLAPWKSEQSLKFLNEKFPMLGVDLTEEIKIAVKHFEAQQRKAAKAAKEKVAA